MERSEIVKVLYRSARNFFLKLNHKNNSITFKEVHLTEHLRVDVVNLSWRDKVIVIELKTCEADFKTDSKWKGYLEYCDAFWFMCPSGVIKITDIPNNIGLIWVDLANGSFSIRQSPKQLKPKYLNNAWLQKTYKKLCFRKFAKFNGELISLDDEKMWQVQDVKRKESI